MKLYLSLFFIFQCFALSCIHGDDKVLCVEIGHSRIKAGILPLNPSLEELKSVNTVESISAPWLGQNIASLFCDKTSPLQPLLVSKTTILSLSIFGTEKYSRNPSGKVEDYPNNLEALITSSFGDTFFVERDTNAWALGALEYLKLQNQAPEYPCLAITLGTGVGLVLIENANTLKTIEFWTMSWHFPKLEALTAHLVNDPVSALGKNFLARLFQGENNIDEGMKEYKGEYNAHLWAFVEDIDSHIEQLFGCKISSVLVGGGHSRFIDSLKTPLPCYLLSPQSLEKEGISPDIIQLLGCIKKVKETNSRTYIITGCP